MRPILFAPAVAVISLACGPSAPSGFSSAPDDRWTFPLVGALEDGLLLAPVYVGSTGPYVFVLDPDAPVSAIDGDVAKQAKLRGIPGPPRVDETGTPRQRAYTEVVALELGSLIVDRRTVIVVRPHTFDSAGRRIHGLIGRDVLADALVLGFDRDQGLGYLTVAGAFQPPPGAIAIRYDEQPGLAGGVPPRRLIDATIAGRPHRMHLDLGAAASQLREPLWDGAGLVARDVQGLVVDEVGTARKIARATQPVAVTAGPVTAEIAFIPYADQRWNAPDVAGALGLVFLAGHSAWLDARAKTLYVRPRAAVPFATRVKRWETGALHKCANPGCVVVRLVDPLAGKPPPDGRAHPGVVLSITREEQAGGMGLEVMIEAAGRPKLPRLIVNLPPHVDRLFDQLAPDYLGASLVVLDASPYPRTCPGKQGCVDKLAR